MTTAVSQISKMKFGDPPSGPGFREELHGELSRERDANREAFETYEDYALAIPEAKFGRLDLRWFPFQREPFYSKLSDEAEEVCFLKSTQIGASSAMIRWAVRRADLFGETILYYFPTDTDVLDFADEKLDPAIDASEYLTSRLAPGFVRQKRLKRIGRGWLYLRGVKSRTGVQSVAGDGIVFDEYDDADPRNLSQAERRLSGARQAGRTPRVRRMGRPSIPGYGIDVAYENSDRRRWLVTCPKCDTEQPLDFFENVRWRSEAGGKDVLRPGHDEYLEKADVTEVWRVCAKCEASLEAPKVSKPAGPIFDGRWVPQNPKKRVLGYHIPRLIVPRADLAAIVEASRETKDYEVETFHNADLGLAYAKADAVLTLEAIEAACSLGGEMVFEYRGVNPVVAGLDVASERDLSMRIEELIPGPEGVTRKALWIGEPHDFDEVAKMMNPFRIALLVVDSLPERRQAKALAATFRGRVILASYATRPEADAISFDPKKTLVTVNRTEAIDAMMDSIRNLTNLPLRRPPTGYLEQLQAPKRRTEEGKDGRPRRYYESTGADDYAHAEVYALVAKEMYGLLRQTDLAIQAEGGSIVDERYGFRGIGGYEPGFGENPLG